MSLAITSTTTTSSTSSSSTSSISDTYNTFLTLLTAQLENQNPLDPQDTTEMTNQLISLGSLEQQLITNETLSTLSSSLNSFVAANGVGYLGKTIETEGSTAPLQDGEANWTYELADTADEVSLTITDSDGEVVWTGSGNTAEGEHSLAWDGIGSDGALYADGDYTLTVSATDASGNTIDVATTVSATVTGIDSTDGSTFLMIGDIAVDLGDVLSVSA